MPQPASDSHRAWAEAAWRRWRQFAHRAAEVQSRVVLFLLYFLVIAPIALVIRMARTRRVTTTAETWHAVTSSPETFESAQNQF
jgi:hypothetical protein